MDSYLVQERQEVRENFSLNWTISMYLNVHMMSVCVGDDDEANSDLDFQIIDNYWKKEQEENVFYIYIWD